MVSKGQFYAIKAALSVTEKEIIKFYELQWFLRHSVPSVEEIVKYINDLYEKQGKQHRTTATSVSYYLQRRKVTKALDDRGIPWRNHARDEITPTQQAAALTISNFADTRSIEQKLDQLGILPATYYAWLKNPQFANLVQSLANENLEHIDPVAKTEFAKKIAQGDWSAIKYYFDVTNTVGMDTAPHSEQIITMIVEIIQRHVKDQDVMLAIANDIMKVMNNQTLEMVPESRMITGEVVSNADLELAKKQLGI